MIYNLYFYENINYKMIEGQNISSKTKCVLQRYDYFKRIRNYLHETDLDLYNNYQINLDIYSNILLKTMYMCKIVSIINDISLETELLLSLENHLFVNDHNNGVQFVPRIYPHPLLSIPKGADTGTSDTSSLKEALNIDCVSEYIFFYNKIINL